MNRKIFYSRKNRDGFTVAELLVVVGIITALLAIGIPQLISQIDRTKLKVDQTHVLEAVSMASSQYAAKHEKSEVVYYYDASDSSIHEWTSEGIEGYGESSKDPYRSQTNVTVSTTYPVVDGKAQLICVKVNGSSIESSWQPMDSKVTPPTPTVSPEDKDNEIKINDKVSIKVAGSWPLIDDWKNEKKETRHQMIPGAIYIYEGKYYIWLDTNRTSISGYDVFDDKNNYILPPLNSSAYCFELKKEYYQTPVIYNKQQIEQRNGNLQVGDLYLSDSNILYIRINSSEWGTTPAGNDDNWIAIQGVVINN